MSQKNKLRQARRAEREEKQAKQVITWSVYVKRTADCLNASVVLFTFQVAPKGKADDGTNDGSRGVGGKVIPVAASSSTRAIGLQQFNHAAHQHGCQPIKDKEPL